MEKMIKSISKLLLCLLSVAQISASAQEVEFIDLGLSVKWADRNIGAASPEQFGDYFAWGETAPKSSYKKSNCKTCGAKGWDNFVDVATATLGDSARMPRMEDFVELIYKCTIEWTTENGVTGRRFTGPNGNSIFLPAAGYRDGKNTVAVGLKGAYWTPSGCCAHEQHDEYKNHCVYGHHINHDAFILYNEEFLDDFDQSAAPRHLGLPVRAVK